MSVNACSRLRQSSCCLPFPQGADFSRQGRFPDHAGHLTATDGASGSGGIVLLAATTDREASIVLGLINPHRLSGQNRTGDPAKSPSGIRGLSPQRRVLGRRLAIRTTFARSPTCAGWLSAQLPVPLMTGSFDDGLKLLAARSFAHRERWSRAVGKVASRVVARRWRAAARPTVRVRTGGWATGRSRIDAKRRGATARTIRGVDCRPCRSERPCETVTQPRTDEGSHRA